MNTRKFKCLIVEDDFTSRKLLSLYLRDIASCDVAESGEEAVQNVADALAAGSPYDLLFLDISLPGMSGQDVLKQIRELEARYEQRGLDSVKVIMTTMHNDPDNITTAFHAGCEAYLVKPIRRDALFSELEKMELPFGQYTGR